MKIDKLLDRHHFPINVNGRKFSIFQGDVTPVVLMQSDPNSNSFDVFSLSCLPASLKRPVTRQDSSPEVAPWLSRAKVNFQSHFM